MQLIRSSTNCVSVRLDTLLNDLESGLAISQKYRMGKNSHLYCWIEELFYSCE